jgi:hypothetical protein
MCPECKMNPALFGLLPFVGLSLQYGSIMAYIIFVNGFLCHGTRLPLFINWDVTCNMLFAVVALMTSQNINLFRILYVIPFAYILSHIFKSNLIHMLGVQLPIAMGMYLWLQEKQPHREPIGPSPLSDPPLI